MILLDSNIIIYSASEKHSYLKKLYKEEDVFASNISRLEVLGYHKITKTQQIYFNTLFSVINTIPISEEIIERAIDLRKTYNLSVGDAIISATAEIKDLTLYTNNEDDFKSIITLNIRNPITDNSK